MLIALYKTLGGCVYHRLGWKTTSHATRSPLPGHEARGFFFMLTRELNNFVTADREWLLSILVIVVTESNVM